MVCEHAYRIYIFPGRETCQVHFVGDIKQRITLIDADVWTLPFDIMHML
jgi:hypothetical protein